MRHILHSKENKALILSRLKKKELELKREFLSKSSGYQSICNELTGPPGWIGSKAEINSWLFSKYLKHLAYFFLTGGSNLLLYLFNRERRRSITVLKELKELNRKREEIEKIQSYFQDIEDSEKSYKKEKFKSLDPWIEKLIASSLTVLPNSKYEELLEKRKDPYLKFLHWYACFIAALLTGGLIIFYLIYRKAKDPNYRFLESSISKHVIEREKFSSYLRELIEKERNFDSLEGLTYFYSKPCQELSYKSNLSTKLFKSNYLRITFLSLMTLLSGGFFILFIYWTSLRMRRNGNYFYNWWAKRRTEEGKIIEPIGSISRSWWGRRIKSFRKLWADLYFSTFFSEVTNNAITTSFFKPKLGIKNLNWALFWMFTSPLGKWMINLILLLLTYTFVLIWDFKFSWAITSWPFFCMSISGVLFLLLSGYHIYLIS